MDWSATVAEIVSALPSWSSPGWNAVAAVAGAASAIAAFAAIRSSSKSRANERVLQHCVTTLERAFSALVGPAENPTLPLRDRLAWLTSARLIEEYKFAKKRLKGELLKSELASHEEHWRRHFYLVLEPLAIGHLAFFQENEIDKTSAIIIHNFSDWPEDKDDPIDKYDGYKNAREVLPVDNRWFALRTYIGLR